MDIVKRMDEDSTKYVNDLVVIMTEILFYFDIFYLILIRTLCKFPKLCSQKSELKTLEVKTPLFDTKRDESKQTFSVDLL